MHEFSMLTGLMRKITHVAHGENAAKVVAVKVKLGLSSHLSPAHLRAQFQMITAGTIAEDARLDIEEVDDDAAGAEWELVLDSVEIAE
jgi:hydrogenase nickel incorporation protein HypA/HybF